MVFQRGPREWHRRGETFPPKILLRILPTAATADEFGYANLAALQVTYNRPFSGCIPVENQSVYGKPAAWCQTTSYTSLHTLGDGQFVITCE